MTTREEKRTQTIIGVGLFAIGVTAFLLDEHPAASWKALTAHHWVQLGIAGLGLLWTPADMTPVKEKIAVVATVVPWIRRPSASVKKPEGE